MVPDHPGNGERKKCFRRLTGSRVISADERDFKICPEKSSVLAKKVSKDAYEIDQTDAKYSITVMFAFSGSGNPVEPMILHPLEIIPAQVIHSIPPPGASVGAAVVG